MQSSPATHGVLDQAAVTDLLDGLLSQGLAEFHPAWLAVVFRKGTIGLLG